MFLPLAYQPGSLLRSLAGTSGFAPGISGFRHAGWRRAYGTASALFALVCVVNVASRLHDSRGSPWWRPAVGEITSILAILAFLWVVLLAADLAGTVRVQAASPADAAGAHPSSRAGTGLAPSGAVPWWRVRLRVGLIHAAAACVFSFLHCLGMWSLRRLIFTLAGMPYGWHVPAGQAMYEFRKDLVTYAVMALVYRGMQAAHVDMPAAPVLPGGGQAPSLYTLRDGARQFRLPVPDILAVSSAGNYVEFHLTGGGTRLVRGTLSGVLADLAIAGFWRVHRCWVVNAASVREVLPEKSGDYRLVLADGVIVPLSRRFPEGLAALRRAAPG